MKTKSITVSAEVGAVTRGLLFPIVFSLQFKRRLIPTLLEEAPKVFYLGRNKKKIAEAHAAANAAIARELAALGIAPDRALIKSLWLDVMSYSAWQRIALTKNA